jgi:hypothetical protein
MATGVTSNNWKEDTHIITDEVFMGDYKYELKYVGKSDEKEILELKPKNKYDLIIGGKKDNHLYFGDNLDVMSFLIHQKKLKGKVKL